MSATVAALDYEELFWFLDQKFHRYHAFELVNGELQEKSICEEAPIDLCGDLPCHDAEQRKDHGCIFCLTLAAVLDAPEAA